MRKAIITICIFLVLLTLGYGFGRYAEKNHYKSIIQREKELSKLPVVAAKTPTSLSRPSDSQLVMGSVVISVDYFKRFISGR